MLLKKTKLLSVSSFSIWKAPGHGRSPGLSCEGSAYPRFSGVLQPPSHPTALMGCVFTWGHGAAHSAHVQWSPSCWECKEGINSGSHSVWGSAHLYLGEAWGMWLLQLHISMEGSRQPPSFSCTRAGYCASGMCIVSSGRNHHVKWVSLPHMEIFSQWSFWAI